MWFLIGASVGAGVALLYAPQSGEETRKLIRQKAESAKESLAEAGAHVKDVLVEKGESIVEAGRGVYRKGVGAAAGAVEGAAELVTRVKEQVASR